MISIQLNKLQFFAHHGLHDEEAITGTHFELDVEIRFNPHGSITSLHQTINYVTVYEVLQRHMKQPVALMEMLAEQIIQELYNLDSRIKHISVSIQKLHPPIPQFKGTVGVSCSKSF